MTAEAEFQGFLDALDERLVQHEERESKANEALTREIAAMFAVMEPAVAAATLAVQVMEDRIREGRDRRSAAHFSTADLAVRGELDLSRIFAHLLDPREAHAQGETFLSLLLEELRWTSLKGATGEDPVNFAAFRSPPGAGSAVTTEHWTGDGKIDIFIDLGDGRRIAIENKPWASDQPKQIKRYLLYLNESPADSGASDTDLENFLVLYWSGDGHDPDWSNEPDEVSAALKRRCVTMPYRETDDAPSVEGWLRRCVVACEAPRVRSFLIDLIRYVEREFQR